MIFVEVMLFAVKVGVIVGTICAAAVLAIIFLIKRNK